MNWKRYRLYFGQTSIVANHGNSGISIKEPQPTKVIFKARNQNEADRKAQSFIAEAELLGTFRVEKEKESQ